MSGHEPAADETPDGKRRADQIHVQHPWRARMSEQSSPAEKSPRGPWGAHAVTLQSGKQTQGDSAAAQIRTAATGMP